MCGLARHARKAESTRRMVLAAGRRRFTQFGLAQRRESSIASVPSRGSEIGNASSFEDFDLVKHAHLLAISLIYLIRAMPAPEALIQIKIGWGGRC